MKILLLSDANPGENDLFVSTLESELDAKVTTIRRHDINKLHGSKIKTLRRYLDYFITAFRQLPHLNQYDAIIGWQQFYTNNLAFYCSLLGIKPKCKIMSLNFTFKPKTGVTGKIYNRYMRRIIKSQRLTFTHVLSNKVRREMIRTFNLPEKSVLAFPFGIDDRAKAIASLKFSHPGIPDGYILSLGRSNRDFDFLAEVMNTPAMRGHHLVIISDTWHPASPLPGNVTHFSNILGTEAYQWLLHSTLNLVALTDPNICSGDTVLLHAMQFGVPTVVTNPSTLAEMYVEHNLNGLTLPKDTTQFAEALSTLLANPEQIRTMSKNARRDYENRYSRTTLARNVSHALRGS